MRGGMKATALVAMLAAGGLARADDVGCTGTVLVARDSADTSSFSHAVIIECSIASFQYDYDRWVDVR